MSTIRVQPSSEEDLANGRAPLPPVAVIFRDPTDGSDLHADIIPFQYGFGTGAFGVAIYLKDESGEVTRGAILRWDGGPDADVKTIHWTPPHCQDDECGSACGHRKRVRTARRS